MEYYAGIDVSLEQSSVCVVDARGRVVREAKVASEWSDPEQRRRRAADFAVDRAVDRYEALIRGLGVASAAA